MKTDSTVVHQCLRTELARFDDQRGYFEEVWRIDQHKEDSILAGFWNQVNISKSKKNVLRGMHCSPYGKLITCIKGSIFDVCLDMRKNSPSWLQWTGEWLTEENKRQIYIPPFCAHGFFSSEDDTMIMYFQSGIYDQSKEREFNCFDPAFKIKWPEAEYVMSEKDKNHKFIILKG